MYEKVSQINYSCINFPTHVHMYSRPGWAGVLRKTYVYYDKSKLYNGELSTQWSAPSYANCILCI